ncbi:MAG: hypothetical protein EHM81_06130 [Chloroflexi bacterium]|nr:MAG: hypothetical protein EHM81_06130 [Chloroflexota bacterium]
MTLPPGLVLVDHSLAQSYVFAVDPNFWEITINPRSSNLGIRYALLGHKTMRHCRIDLVPPMGPPAPDKLYVLRVGRFGWQVSDYTSAAMFHFKELYLFLDNFANPDCRAAQEQVLANMFHAAEYYGDPTLTPPAPRAPSPLAGFKCPKALEPRLRPRDVAYIIADSITLRHTPDIVPGSKYRAWGKYAPVIVQIDGNPVCVDKQYVFWKVTVSEMGEGGQEYQGWMAESGPEEYYLENLNPGW